MEFSAINRVSEILADSLTDEEAQSLNAARNYPFDLSTAQIDQLVSLRLITVSSDLAGPEITKLGMDVLMREARRRTQAAKKSAA